MTAFSPVELRTFHFNRISDVGYSTYDELSIDEPPSLSDVDNSPLGPWAMAPGPNTTMRHEQRTSDGNVNQKNFDSLLHVPRSRSWIKAKVISI